MTPRRLVTTARLVANGPARHEVDLLHELELADGRRLVALDDRGFGGSGPLLPDEDALRADARTSVGPDEPTDDATQDDAARWHWEWVAGQLARRGVEVAPATLAALPHDVVLDEALLAAVREKRA